MAEEWDGNEIGLVAEVDCTSKTAKPICSAFGIESFPTLMYGDPNDMTEYEGGRSYEELSAFAKENLVPVCSAKNMDLCDEGTRSKLEEYYSMTLPQLNVLMVKEKQKIDKAEVEWQTKVDQLQEEYDEATTTKQETIKAIREGGLNLMQSVKKARGASLKKDSDQEGEL